MLFFLLSLKNYANTSKSVLAEAIGISEVAVVAIVYDKT